MGSQSDIESIDKETDKRYQIDNDDHNTYYERDQMGER